ncbi:PA0069 family radical SAM protein, partial [Pseudomonas aeruginosa]
AYWDLSQGIDFETRLIAKSNVASELKQELSKPGYRCTLNNLGANTNPYHPLERRRRLARQVREVLLHFRHPLTIITKGSRIL